MTLIKSLLLGSAAGIVAVASAQAADLPTKKAAPVEYVKVCNVGGITGWTLPGSDTCVKFSGYITAQFTGGNLNTQYNYGSIRATRRRLPRILSSRQSAAVAAAFGLACNTGTPSGFAISDFPHYSAGPDCRQPRSEQHDIQSALRPAGRPAPTSGSTWPRTPPTAP